MKIKIDIPYTTIKDVENTVPIVKDELGKHGIVMDKEDLYKLTINIMSVSYAKGGWYSDYEIRNYTREFIESNIYRKFITF